MASGIARTVLQDGRQKKKSKELRLARNVYPNPVLPKDAEFHSIPHFYSEEESVVIFDKLVSELNLLGTGVINWSCHQKCEVPQESPTFNAIVKRMTDHFFVKPVEARLNYFRNGEDWKPFHHDSHIYSREAQMQENFTVGISFGAIRDFALLEKQSGIEFMIQCKSGDLFAFDSRFNQSVQHGVKPSDPNSGGRISLVAWCNRQAHELYPLAVSGKLALTDVLKLAADGVENSPEKDAVDHPSGGEGKPQEEEEEQQQQQEEKEALALDEEKIPAPVEKAPVLPSDLLPLPEVEEEKKPGTVDKWPVLPSDLLLPEVASDTDEESSLGGARQPSHGALYDDDDDDDDDEDEEDNLKIPQGSAAEQSLVGRRNPDDGGTPLVVEEENPRSLHTDQTPCGVENKSRAGVVLESSEEFYVGRVPMALELEKLSVQSCTDKLLIEDEEKCNTPAYNFVSAGGSEANCESTSASEANFKPVVAPSEGTHHQESLGKPHSFFSGENSEKGSCAESKQSSKKKKKRR